MPNFTPKVRKTFLYWRYVFHFLLSEEFAPRFNVEIATIARQIRVIRPLLDSATDFLLAVPVGYLN